MVVIIYIISLILCYISYKYFYTYEDWGWKHGVDKETFERNNKIVVLAPVLNTIALVLFIITVILYFRDNDRT